MKCLDVTRTTIKNDMHDIKENLREFGLQLQYKEKFSLVGSKDDIFKYQMSCLNKIKILYTDHSEVIDQTLKEYITKIFPNIDFKSIVLAVRNFNKRESLFLNDSEYSWVLRVIILSIWYQNNGIEMPLKSSLEKAKIVDYNYDALFDEIQNSSVISLDEELKHTIKMICSIIKVDSVIQKDDVLQTDVLLFVVKMIIGLNETYRACYKNNIIFLSALYNHVLNLFKRVNYSVDIAILDDYQIPLPSDLKKYIENFVIKYNYGGYGFDDYDIKMIQLHFANYYQYNARKEIKALLVCGLTYYHSWMLKKQLESFFFLKIVDIIPSYEISKVNEFEDLNFIFSTEDILEHSMLKFPLLKINYILIENDFIKLYKNGIPIRQTQNDQEQCIFCLDDLSHFDFSFEKGEILSELKMVHAYANIYIHAHLGVKNDVIYKKSMDKIYLDIETKDFVLLSAKLIEYAENLI